MYLELEDVIILKNIGKKFGRLTILSLERKDKNNKKYYLCECECGNKEVIRYDSLTSGRTTSCGCYNKEVNRKRKGEKVKDITDQKFGRLTALYRLERTDKYYSSYWLCECECGNKVEVRINQLTTGKTKSCGCLNRELSSKRMSGENHPFWGVKGEKHFKWNPNLTDDEREDKRDTVENYHFRKNVFKRDDYTCQCCNRKSKKGNPITLNAHHIVNYYNHPNDRYNVNNGITLCDECHKKFHKKYGNRDNNLNQLEEFIKDNTEVI